MFQILLTLIFIEPFVFFLIEFSFPYFIYSSLISIFLVAWILVRGLPLKTIQPIKYPFLAFTASLLVALVFSYNKTVSLKALEKYITALLLFLIAASLQGKEKRMLIKGITLAAIFVSVLAIYQYLFSFKHLSEYIAENNITDQFILDFVNRKRVFFPFATPNMLGGYLAMILPLALIDKKKIWVIILLSSAFLLTQSLGALLSLFFGIMVFFYLQEKLGKKAFFFLSGLLIITGLVLIIRLATRRGQMHPVFSALMRLSYWKDTLQIIRLSPLTGVGLGNFNIASTRYAHNSYLQIWAEMGILGIGSILWLLTGIFKCALSSIKSSPYRNQTVCFISACSVFLAHNLIDFTFFIPEVAFIWWVILGLTLSKE